MGRRIFEEREYCLQGSVLSVGQFRLFYDLENGCEIPEFRCEELLKKAEQALEKDIPQLLASDYMLFCRTGNRSVYEEKYFSRRVMLLDLALGEWLEQKGRFTEKLIDVLWAILEESTWVIPAHNRHRPADGVGKTTHASMPYSFDTDVDYIDLFSAATGAAVAVAYYFHMALFDTVSPEINNRICYELDRQLLKPFCNDQVMHNVCKWSGLSGNPVNNWCPWIVTNILTVCAFTVDDERRRTEIVERSLPLMDNFAAANHPDGGCDEGPRYWELAGGSLWAGCALLNDLTGGYINVFDDPLLKNMGEYEVKMIAAPGHLLNFADATRSYIPNPYLLYHWGATCRSSMLTSCAGWLMNAFLPSLETDYRTPYKYLRYLTTPQLTTGACSVVEKAYIESLQIAITRAYPKLDKGLYLAVKGGHNGESHNHNDLGNFVVYSDGAPVLIDAGVGEYTKRYFGPDRYEVWHTCSDYHNCASFNGIAQHNGKEYRAEDVIYDPVSGSVSMSLLHAYPENAGLKHYRRLAGLENEQITVVDDIEFHLPGISSFSLICLERPTIICENSFSLCGKTVTFDPSLEYRLEQLDCTIPEAEPIPGYWGVDALYRITLTAKEKIQKKTYILTIQ